LSPAGLRWRGPAATVHYSTLNLQLSKENFKEKEKLVTGPDGGLTPGRAGRLTVGRKITLTLTFEVTLVGNADVKTSL
jgi:hypothetical protein